MKRVTSENPQIVLASGSPRRLELMRMLGFDPRVRVSAVEEVLRAGETGESYTSRLCREKAAGVRETLNSEDPDWILAADTVVECDGHILEKPADIADAVDMLRSLSARSHTVTTSFCWLDRSSGAEAVRSVSAKVWFRELDDDTIRHYVATGEPMDKAGAYGVQGIGACLVSRIEGSYHAVVGLPICEVIQTLDEAGGLAAYPFARRR
jgi:septum formation protein